MPKNVLYIMCDQLRFDYLGCSGHPHLKTQHIDALAARGVRFDQAYVQSPICGPSRMSAYTGRYVRSHGSTWNSFPLRIGEMTIGDHLTPLGIRTALCGKTHMYGDLEGMERLGIDPESDVGRKIKECGFEVWDRLEGIHPTGGKGPTHYNDYLADKGYEDANPWEDVANSSQDEDGNILSGWLMENADKPARIANEDSETPYTTTRAIEFIEDAGDEPWCLHLSYIKPHWPYIVPSPYHEMYGPEHVLPAVRSDVELADPHPVFAAFMQHRYSKVFTRDEVRERVIPAYMGLIAQIDDEIGRLMAFLDGSGISEETLIVFTADHGDYLGDHWLGEKELFHDPSVRIPLIVVDPCKEADVTRNTVSDALVEAIDLLPTFLDWYGAQDQQNYIEGRSLLPLLHGEETPWRQAVFSEYDYSTRLAKRLLDQPIADCRLTMVFDGRWKYVHAEGFRPMLHDLKNDPQELSDLGAEPGFQAERDRLAGLLGRWNRQHHNRVTVSDSQIGTSGRGELEEGVLIGFWDEEDLTDAMTMGESGN